MKSSTEKKFSYKLEDLQRRLQATSNGIDGKDEMALEKWKNVWGRVIALIAAIRRGEGETVEVSNEVSALTRSTNWLERRVGGIEEAEESLPLFNTLAEIEPAFGTLQKLVVDKLRVAQQSTLEAYDLVIENTPVAEYIPEVQEVKMLANKIGDLIRGISRIRGL